MFPGFSRTFPGAPRESSAGGCTKPTCSAMLGHHAEGSRARFPRTRRLAPGHAVLGLEREAVPRRAAPADQAHEADGPRRLLHALPGGPRHPLSLERVVRMHRGVRRRGREAGHARVAVRRGPLALGRRGRPGDEGSALAPAIARDAGGRFPARVEVGRRRRRCLHRTPGGTRGTPRAADPPGRTTRVPPRGRGDPRLRRGGRSPLGEVQRVHLSRHPESPGGAPVHRRHARGVPQENRAGTSARSSPASSATSPTTAAG